MDEHQEQFLRDEFFSLILMATVQRAHIYVADADDRAKSRFHQSLRSSLERLEAFYSETVAEDDHIQNVIALSDELSKDHADVLADRRF